MYIGYPRYHQVQCRHTLRVSIVIGCQTCDLCTRDAYHCRDSGMSLECVCAVLRSSAHCHRSLQYGIVVYCIRNQMLGKEHAFVIEMCTINWLGTHYLR